MDPRVNITMVTYNRLAFTRRSIEALRAHTRHPHVLTVVDNCSSDGTVPFLKRLHAQPGIVDYKTEILSRDEVAKMLQDSMRAADVDMRERALREEQVEGRRKLEAVEAALVTVAPDSIDWDDEVRMAIESRTALSPDALTGMEANLRFGGPETMETKIFARLTAWQNWIFQRPNAVGAEGALKRYGTGQKAVFDMKRV